jgi:serine/threonine-protein kinase RsbW
MAKAEENHVRITLTLNLPRDESTVPVARHIVRASLEEIGVAPGCTSDIEIALSEASTNVLKHSGPGDEYAVSCEMNDTTCVIRVVDTGHGFDHATLGYENADMSAEQGRGIQLMRALVDRAQFLSKPEEGTIVHLEKSLEFEPGSLAAPTQR